MLYFFYLTSLYSTKYESIRARLLDLVLEGVEPLIQMESRSDNFGAKLTSSLNGADPSFMNSVTGSICRAKCSNILQDGFSTFSDHLSKIIFLKIQIAHHYKNVFKTLFYIIRLKVSFLSPVVMFTYFAK